MRQSHNKFMDGIVLLPSAKKLLLFFEWVVERPGLHLIIGETASGKSAVARAFAWQHPGKVVYVEAIASPYGEYPAATFLESVLRTVDMLGTPVPSTTEMVQRIARALCEQGRALIIDEASHLPKPLLQTLRWISDPHWQNPSLSYRARKLINLKKMKEQLETARLMEKMPFFDGDDPQQLEAEIARLESSEDDEEYEKFGAAPLRRGSPLILMGVPRLRRRVAALDEVEGRVYGEIALPSLTMSDVEIILLSRFADRHLVKWILESAGGKVRPALALAAELEQAAREDGQDPRTLTMRGVVGSSAKKSAAVA